MASRRFASPWKPEMSGESGLRALSLRPCSQIDRNNHMQPSDTMSDEDIARGATDWYLGIEKLATEARQAAAAGRGNSATLSAPFGLSTSLPASARVSVSGMQVTFSCPKQYAHDTTTSVRCRAYAKRGIGPRLHAKARNVPCVGSTKWIAKTARNPNLGAVQTSYWELA